jgi:hypothetical protein
VRAKWLINKSNTRCAATRGAQLLGVRSFEVPQLIPKSCFSRCLSRPPRSFSRLHLHRHIYLYRHCRRYSIVTHTFYLSVVLEARYDVRRLETRRSRGLARHNRDSTSTTHLPSVTPSCERTNTAWCKIWTSDCRCRPLKTPSDHVPVDSSIIATVAPDPCRYHGSVCCG